MKLPNLIIAGAPKCGTSSLFEWITSHPEVCGSIPKETFYFMDTTDPLIKPSNNYNLHGLERYQSFFKDCNSNTGVIVEATTHYMYQETARIFFGNLIPQPKVIFVLRNPSQLVFSSFRAAQNNVAVLSKEISFSQYVELLLENRLELIKNSYQSERAFFIHKNLLLHGEYYSWIKKWSTLFSPENIYILLFENMIKDPRYTLKNLSKYIGIDPLFYENFIFDVKNQTVPIKNIAIHRVASIIAPYIFSIVKPKLKSIYFKIQYGNFNTKETDHDALLKLSKYFSEHNKKLSNEFDVNIDCWSKI